MRIAKTRRMGRSLKWFLPGLQAYTPCGPGQRGRLRVMVFGRRRCWSPKTYKSYKTYKSLWDKRKRFRFFRWEEGLGPFRPLQQLPAALLNRRLYQVRQHEKNAGRATSIRTALSSTKSRPVNVIADGVAGKVHRIAVPAFLEVAKRRPALLVQLAYAVFDAESRWARLNSWGRETVTFDMVGFSERRFPQEPHAIAVPLASRHRSTGSPVAFADLLIRSRQPRVGRVAAPACPAGVLRVAGVDAHDLAALVPT